LVHGILYSKYYHDFAISLAEKKYIVHTFDLLGFGYSGGVKYNTSSNKIFKCIHSVLKLITDKLPLYGELKSDRR
jgi:pimeloyl-ACP methyl ester carboxylesterase